MASTGPARRAVRRHGRAVAAGVSLVVAVAAAAAGTPVATAGTPVATAAVTGTAAVGSAAPAPCRPVWLFAAAGSGADVVGAVAGPLSERLGDRLRVVTAPPPAPGTSYAAAQQEAVGSFSTTVTDVAARCPTAKLLLVGFSEGAHVAGDLASRIGTGQERGIPAERILAVGLFGDPARSPFTRFVPAEAGGQGVLPVRAAGFGALDPRTIEICAPKDPVCDSPAQATFPSMGEALKDPVHASYPQLPVARELTSTRWVVDSLVRVVDAVPDAPPAAAPPPGDQPAVEAPSPGVEQRPPGGAIPATVATAPGSAASTPPPSSSASPTSAAPATTTSTSPGGTGNAVTTTSAAPATTSSGAAEQTAQCDATTTATASGAARSTTASGGAAPPSTTSGGDAERTTTPCEVEQTTTSGGAAPSTTASSGAAQQTSTSGGGPARTTTSADTGQAERSGERSGSGGVTDAVFALAGTTGFDLGQGGNVENGEVPVAVASPNVPGRQAVKMELPAGGKRSEVRPEDAAQDIRPGERLFFGYSAFLPQDFPTDFRGFQVVWQLHDGETNTSPPVALEIQQGRLWLANVGDLVQDLGPVSPGENVTVQMDIEFAIGGGTVSLWRNGQQVLDRFQPPKGTMIDGFDFLKSGVYRDEDNAPPLSLFLNDLKVGDSLESVSGLAGAGA